MINDDSHRQIYNICKTNVKRNQSRVKCISCQGLFHLCCVVLPFAGHECKKWQCAFCTSRLDVLLPLFNLSNHDFNAGLGNEISNNGNMIYRYDMNELNSIFQTSNSITPVNN